MAEEQDQNTQGQNALDQNAQDQNPAEKQLLLQKIYIKDLSFESPKAPDVFTTDAQAQTQLNMRSDNRDIDEQNVEVALRLTVESKHQEDTIFLIEIVQAGIFAMRGFTQEERSTLLGSYCPNTLFPFAREAISDIVTKGGFPQLLLQPINFDALYAQAMQERAAQQAATNGPVDVTMPPAPPADPTGNGGAN